jgi:hypothetical protein
LVFKIIAILHNTPLAIRRHSHNVWPRFCDRFLKRPLLTVSRSFMNFANRVLWRMAIILKTNKVNLFVSSVLFVFWYHSPNVLDTLHICNISWLRVNRAYGEGCTSRTSAMSGLSVLKRAECRSVKIPDLDNLPRQEIKTMSREFVLWFVEIFV